MASGVQALVLTSNDLQSKKAPECSYFQQCLLCQQCFNLEACLDDFLHHILHSHGLVIADVDKIAYVHRYVEYWRVKLATNSLDSVCIGMKDNTEDGEKHYYLLSPLLPEDEQLRTNLLSDRLQQVLSIQQAEREDNSATWKCLFCAEDYSGNRSLVLNHMNEEHNFNIGHPDNLVNVRSFIERLRFSLDRLVCLYCEKTFKDKFTLKEHMRKKLHKKVNPKNKEYDQYYLVNYLEMGEEWIANKCKKVIKRKGKSGVMAYISKPGEESDTEEGWLEGEDTTLSQQFRALCLFCEYTGDNSCNVYQHMAKSHGFNISSLKEENGLNFYHQIKIINYVRFQVLDKRCVACGVQFKDGRLLADHMTSSRHITSFVKDRAAWDQPMFYFSTYENDNLLSGEADGMEDPTAGEDWVIPEDRSSVESDVILYMTSILKNMNRAQVKDSSVDHP